MDLMENRDQLRGLAINSELLNSINGGVISTLPRILKNEEGFEIHIKAPSIPADQFKVNVNVQDLVIASYKRSDISSKIKSPIFYRSFFLPNFVDIDRIEAVYDHGELTVTVPFKEDIKGLHRDIEVQHPDF